MHANADDRSDLPVKGYAFSRCPKRPNSHPWDVQIGGQALGEAEVEIGAYIVRGHHDFMGRIGKKMHASQEEQGLLTISQRHPRSVMHRQGDDRALRGRRPTAKLVAEAEHQIGMAFAL